ncbi:MAG: hypothetical protein RBT03_02485 [Kiritimatiellia bacterium]|jgi:hypothetical protein|nr:hypothetical protein [Kiritimatiellia bacterium]
MNDYPLACIIGAIKTTTGGVLSFYAGLVGGSIILFSEQIFSFTMWGWCLVAWLALIPYTIAKLWGIVLAFLLGIILIGTIWREWNRLIIFSSVAILLSTTTLYCAKYNPLTQADAALPFMITMGLALVLFAIGVTWEIIKKHPVIGSRDRGQGTVPPDP